MKFICIKHNRHITRRVFRLWEQFETDDPSNYNRTYFTPIPKNWTAPAEDKRFWRLDAQTKLPKALPHPEIDKILEEEAKTNAEAKIRRKLQDDLRFGRGVIESYLLDNKKLALNASESLSQLQKFSGLKALLEVGSIKDCPDMLKNIETDNIFTQERKDKYLKMITDYLQRYE